LPPQFPEYVGERPVPLVSGHLHPQSKQKEVHKNAPADEEFPALLVKNGLHVHSNETVLNPLLWIPAESSAIFQCQAHHIPVVLPSTYFFSFSYPCPFIPSLFPFTKGAKYQ
jgi:hypothetical protein